MDSKEQAEIQQLLSEAARNEAEKHKFELEASEVEKRMKQKWFSGRAFIQALIGGVVGSALVAAWIVGYFSPILSKKQELANLENSRLQVEAQEEKRKNEQAQRKLEWELLQHKERLKAFKEQNDQLQKAITASEERAKSLQDRLQKTIDTYNEQITKQPSEDERTRLAKLSDEALVELEKLKAQIVDFQNEKEATEERSSQISQQLVSLENTKYTVAVYSLNASQSIHDDIKRYFLNGGYVLDYDWILPERQSWVALKSTVFYYHKDTREKARKIADDLKKITGSDFQVAQGAGLGVVRGQEQWTIFIHYIA